MLITDDRPSSHLDDEDTPPSLLFDRRTHTRLPAEGKLLAAVPAASSGVRLTQLELIDSSPAGIGVMASGPVSIGVPICLYPLGASVARECGIVARCDPQPDGRYLVGVSFERRMAA
ncbi:MAG: hypothetical protein ACF8R7_18465 [Phycisphaerales bacterium JB039]